MDEDYTSTPGSERPSSFNIVILLASLVIIITGMHYAAPILIPFLLAIFISILCIPLQRYLINKNIPATMAVVLILCLLLIGTFLLVGFVGASMNEFTNQLPEYQEQLETQLSAYIIDFQKIGLALPGNDLQSILRTDNAISVATNAIKKVGSVLTNFVLVWLIVIFILLEASSFKHKIQLAFNNSQNTLDSFDRFMTDVNHYLAIKTIFSLMTGIVVTLGLLLLGVNHAPLWGLIAFLLNFIPNIGSFIAAAPAIALALIQIGPAGTVLVAILYLTVNMVFGNLLEPRFMGKGLGLSTLVVFLSLLFWGAIFGPVGMILSVPLTMIVKLALEQNEETRWMAILLGSGRFAKQELSNSELDIETEIETEAETETEQVTQNQ